MRVVLAEDLALLRDRMIRLLTAYDFEVVDAVDNGPALLRALTEHRPDVAVVDVRLPPTFTDEGLRAALAARAQLPGLPVLVVSQQSSSCTRGSCSRRAPAASGTCSRTGSPTSRNSSTPSGGSPPAAPPWTPR